MVDAQNLRKNSKDLDLSMAGRELTAHAPLFANFIPELAVNTDRGKNIHMSRSAGVKQLESL